MKRLIDHVLTGVFLLLFLLLFSTSNSFGQQDSHRFTFDKNLSGWGVWGDGTARHIQGLGHLGDGAVELSSNKDQQITLHKKFDLPPGRYKVTGWLRALDVQKGAWDYSIWLFFQTDEQIESPVTNLKGSFDWSRFSYTMEVKEKGADVWFRLKSAGTLWLDDIEIVPTSSGSIGFSFLKSEKVFPKPNPAGKGVRCPNCHRWMARSKKYCDICGELLTGTPQQVQKDVLPEKVLLGFEKQDRAREKTYYPFKDFNDQNSSSGHSSAIIKTEKYYNFQLTDSHFRDWSGYDYLEMDVFNPLQSQIKIMLCVGDNKSSDYWNQLNHYSLLGPGWNTLKFSIKRYVGERGSVRVKRYLQLERIEKFWFRLDKPKVKDQSSSAEFLLDNVKLKKAPQLGAIPEDFLLFDFVKENFRSQHGFIPIESKHNYHKDVGFGFVDADIWRAHDSIYADTLHRDGIFVNSGAFRVDVPDGKYLVNLVPFALGEWFEHFWTKRKIEVNGITVLNEQRGTSDDYLDDFLRFSEIEPQPSDNPYDLYLKKIFRPIQVEVDVTDGSIVIEVDGDDSGVMLNSLIIYPVEKKEVGKRLMQQLERVLQNEFAYISRRLEPKEIVENGAIGEEDEKRGFYSALIDSSVQLRYNHVLKSSGDRITLGGGKLQRPVQAFLVRNLRDIEKLHISLSPLTSSAGERLEVEPGWLRYGVAQYQSHSFNHETYELAPRFLRNFPKDGLALAKDYSLLLWYQIPIRKEYRAGLYKGTVEIELHNEKISYPVMLTVKDFTLPEVDMAVGFFGLDPVAFNFYKGDDVSKTKSENRIKVLRSLASRGFTTWSSLPEASFEKSGDDWVLRAEKVDQLMRDARTLGFHEKIFTYGGKFPIVLDNYGQIDGASQEIYREKTSRALESHMRENNWLPVVFDISDEAAGYSDKVDRDMKRAQMLEKYFPYLRLGGYSHPIAKGEPGHELNNKFTDISLSSSNRKYSTKIINEGRRWGYYNQAMGLFSNNRDAFGKRLHEARKLGCDHLLGWSLVLSQNYPYYDLDGRENDAMMIFPRKDGSFDYALKFEWASQGLEDYRLLMMKERQQ